MDSLDETYSFTGTLPREQVYLWQTKIVDLEQPLDQVLMLERHTDTTLCEFKRLDAYDEPGGRHA